MTNTIENILLKKLKKILKETKSNDNNNNSMLYSPSMQLKDLCRAKSSR